MTSPISVILVDDHSIFRAGLAQTLQLSPTFRIVGEGSSADEALALVEKLHPQVALLDLYMPGGGIDAIRVIHGDHPEVKLIALTFSEEDDDVVRALDAGASGYILKGVNAEELIGAVLSVSTGATYVAPTLGKRLVNAIRSHGEQNRKSQMLSSLTIKERETLSLIGEGMSNAEIAARSGVNIKTVKFHVSNLLKKLDARNRVELALHARQGASAARK